jgi:predicted MFS family arabinose efflux permease
LKIKSRLSRQQRLLLLVLAAINFLHIMDFMILMPLAPQLMRKLAINPAQFSLLVASYSVSAGIASFAGTFFVDRFSRKRTLLSCFAGFIIGTLLCGLSGTYPLLLAARIVTGLLGGIIGSQVLSLVADTFPPQLRGRATGMVMAGFSAASVLGVPAGLYLGTLYGWQMPFFVIAAFGVMVFAAAYRILPRGIRHLVAGRENAGNSRLLGEILSFPQHRLALLFTFLVSFSHFTMIPFLSPYMVANVGFKELELSYIYITGGAITLFTGPYFGKLVDRFGAAKVFTILVLVAFIPQYAISHMASLSIWIALLFTSMFFIFSGGRFIPSQTLTLNAVEPRYRGGFMSLNSSLMQFSSGLAGFLAGKVIQKLPDGSLQYYDIIGWSTIFFSLLTILIARRMGSLSSNKTF